MKPILFSADEISFTTNGMGRLSDVLSCKVTEERNGIYICEFVLPVTSPMYSLVQEGRYIAVIHDDKHDIQPFEIYGRSAPIDGNVTFWAHHLSYKLKNVILKPFTASSCAQALSKFETETYNRQRFTFWTDKNVSATFKNIVPSSCRSLLAGQTGSVLDVYGTGEYEFDKWAVKLYLHRGNDNGVAIRYGVNLTNIQQDLDSSESYSAIAPYWKSEDGETVVMLPEGFVVSNDVPIQKFPWTTKSGEYVQTKSGEIIEFAIANIVPVPIDFSADFDEAPTVEELRQHAEDYLENNSPWLPTESITVSFVDLAHTEDYKDIAALQRVSLCDYVSVYCGPLGVKAVSMQVVKTVYNVLTETYDEIELGKPRTNFADTVMVDVDKRLEEYPKTTVMDNAINHATQLITGGLGGYVVFNMNADGEPQEILIMDTPDTSTAVNVWRFNKNGLGHSHNGYDGPFDDVALTADGQINASMITTGYLLATLIRGGTLLLGGLDNTNGVMEIQNANGDTIGEWTKDGIKVLSGLIQGALIKLGGINNTNGTLQILDASGNVIGLWDKDGINVSKGTIAGPSIILGGNNNANGTLTIKDASNNIIGFWGYNQFSVDTSNLKVSTSGLLQTYGYTQNYGYGTVSIQGGRIDFKKDGTSNSSTIRNYSNGGFAFLSEKYFFKDVSNNNDYFWIEYPIAVFEDVTTVRVENDLEVWHNFSVLGTKSRRVSTQQYSDRLLYCYETPSPLFGDVGDGVIADDGLCYITIDSVFAQTITTNQYQVFLQKYGAGDCWIKERKGGYFVVEGTPGLAFGWELKAKQKDFDQKRLDNAEMPYTPTKTDYGADAANYIDQLRKDRESA